VDKYKLSLEEKESIITWDESCNVATIYTFSKSLQSKFDKYCRESSGNWELISVDSPSKTYRTNKSFVSFRGCKRSMTEEQKKAGAERLQIAREKKAL